MQDEKINVKIILSILWVVHVLSWIVGDIIRTTQPGYVENVLLERSISNEILLVGSVIYLAQFLMIILSLLTKAKVNRIANMSLGAIFCLLNIAHLVDSIEEPVWEIFLGVVYLAIAGFIVWSAWKWPKESN